MLQLQAERDRTGAAKAEVASTAAELKASHEHRASLERAIEAQHEVAYRFASQFPMSVLLG